MIPGATYRLWRDSLRYPLDWTAGCSAWYCLNLCFRCLRYLRRCSRAVVVVAVVVVVDIVVVAVVVAVVVVVVDIAGYRLIHRSLLTLQ